jgi:hypothetical protein
MEEVISSRTFNVMLATRRIPTVYMRFRQAFYCNQLSYKSLLLMLPSSEVLGAGSR